MPNTIPTAIKSRNTGMKETPEEMIDFLMSFITKL